jgi:DNA-directed RNA polymerase subunit beta
MAGNIACGRRVRKDFSKIPSIVEIPNLIEIQQQSYEQFLQKDVASEKREEMGLQAVFKSVFPIADYNGNATLEFHSYHFGDPKYTVEECHDRGMTFAIPLKVTLRLKVVDNDKETKTQTIREVREQEVYLGELPLMTEKGTFIINGTERVVVSQLQRSAGVFFDDDKGKTVASGKLLFSARVIPYRGSWVEFEFDANEILYVRVDRRRKMLATAFLRAFWFLEKGVILSDEEILGLFYETEEVQAFEDRLAWVKLSPEVHNGARPAEDVKAPKGKEVLVQAGKALNPKSIEKLVESGVTRIAVKAEALVGRRTGGKVIDSETGEVLIEANQEITATLLAQIMARTVAPFKVLAIVPGGRMPRSTRPCRVTTSRTPTRPSVEIYRRLRPGDPPTVDSARALFRGMFMDPRRYDLARVGRFMINKKLGISANLNIKALRSEDVVAVVRHLLQVKLGSKSTDDIDHLGNRRVRSVGELLENQFRVGLTRMERAVKERMSISDITNLMPHDLINAKPVSAVVKEFFGSSQLSQFMDQTNPLAELTHKRRLSALGPRGLSRERAGFEVRDVHPTHYGRICPIETPEGPNIGLISSLSTYAQINEFGFIETPYRKVEAGGVVEGPPIYLTALEEEQYVIAQANAELDAQERFVRDLVSARKGGEYKMVSPEELHFIDISPKQLVSVAAAMVPFLENDDANRPSWAPTCSARRCRCSSRRRPWSGRAWSTSWPGIRGRSCSPSAWAWSSTCRPTASSCGRRHGPRRRIRSGPAARHLQLDQVPPLQPEHVHQPASDRPQGGPGQGGGRHRRRARHRSGRARPRPERARRLHAVGRVQLRGRHPRVRAARQGLTAIPRSTSRSSRSRRATRSSARKR